MRGLRYDQTAPRTQWTWGAGKGSWENEPAPPLQGFSQRQQVLEEGRFWQVQEPQDTGDLEQRGINPNLTALQAKRRDECICI